MKFNEDGFRPIYHKFCVFKLNDEIKKLTEGFPGIKKANCVLTYGYYDKEKGLTLEILAAGIEKDGSVDFFEPVTDRRVFVIIDSVADIDFGCIFDENGDMTKALADRLAVAKQSKASDEIEQTRQFAFLDKSRDKFCIDDVFVYLEKEGNKSEGCWTRITGIGDHCFIGTLLNEPEQDFGCHKGESIKFCVRQEEKKVVCYCDRNSVIRFKSEDLADGRLLESAVNEFIANRNAINLHSVLTILRDSIVWVPCVPILSNSDKERLDEMVNKYWDDLEGQEIVMHDEIRLVPDVYQAGEIFYFPVFSTEEAIGENRNGTSMMPMSFIEAINLARNNEKDINGIILNAFTNQIIIIRDMWKIVEEMESHLQE